MATTEYQNPQEILRKIVSNVHTYQKPQQVEDAISYMKQYVSSEGFRERFKKAIPYIEKYATNSQYNSNWAPRYDVTEYQIGMEFNPKSWPEYEYKDSFITDSNYSLDDNKIAIGNHPDIKGYGKIAAHEFGHWVAGHMRPYLIATDHMGPITKDFEYPYIFPHFRESRSYKEMLDKPFLTETGKTANYEQDPNYYYKAQGKLSHDASPWESHADLESLRYELYRLGIYDSRKANNPFTQEHLNKFKQTGTHNRLLDNFKDEQIISMMNDIADNGNMNNQDIYYG